MDPAFIIRRVDEDGQPDSPFYGPFDTDDAAVAYSQTEAWESSYEIAILVQPVIT